MQLPICKLRTVFNLSYFVFFLLPGCSSEPASSVSYPQVDYSYVPIEFSKLEKQEKVYVPVYSDIYHLSGDKRFLLTVTAIVRNTSLQDTIYVNKVDYYNSKGGMLREYLQKSIAIGPLASAEFIVEYLENQGGAGASFVIDWGSHNAAAKPLIQAVMIGTLAQQGISFVTEGVAMQQISPDSVVVK